MTTSTTAAPIVDGDDLGEWRGVAADRGDEMPERIGVLLRLRSRRLLGELLRPHRASLYLLLALIVTENLAMIAGPYLVGAGIDDGIPAIEHHQGSGRLWVFVVLLAVAALVQAVTQRAFMLLSGRIGQDVVLDLRTRLFTRFQLLSQAFHEDYTSGRVISRQTSDIEAINEFLEDGVDSVVTAILSTVLVGATMLVLDWPLALVGLASFIPLAFLTRWFRRESAKAYRKTREAVALVVVQFVETLAGIRAVQAFRREPRNAELFEDLNERYRKANKKSFGLIAIFAPSIKLVGNVTVGIVLLYGGYRVIGGQLEIGVLTSFLLYLRGFFDPLQDLSQTFNSFQSAGAALEKIAGVLDEPLSVPPAQRPVTLGHARGELHFHQVSFGYRESTVIPALDLKIAAGQTVALVGQTGAGKTTIARLLGRFYDPTQGRITLDGVDLRDIGETDLHRAVVTVTQESFLFSGTVADNIAFGRPDASRADIVAAAREIGAHEFITRLPAGYDTDVRKRGGRLSAGQRQLVSFARAFLADPAVLILDEATSSLDIPSERLVQQALRTILADRTAVIIAHRLSTVAIADRVLVLSAGRVVEDGSPQVLVAAGGRYADLHEQWQDSLT